MKHIKSFENNIEIIGDFVICKELEYNIKDVYKKELNDFLLNNIGLCVDYDSERKEYEIEYENIPINILTRYFFVKNKYNDKYIRYMRSNEIIHHSKNKEDLEPYIQSNKYNL
jgi:hypothetical protein